MVANSWAAVISVGGVFGGALLCLPMTRQLPWKGLCSTALYLLVDDEVLIHSPRIYGLHWNWIGKLSSILLALVAMRGFRLSCEKVGFKAPRKGSWRWVFAGVTTLVFVNVLRSRGMYHQPIDVETILYQATMPGLAEELVYRGVAYALLLRAYDQRRDFAAILIPSCCFGLAHLGPLQGSIPPTVLWTMVGFGALQFGSMTLLGALLALLRWRSGSLLGPLLSHGAFNIAGTVAAGRV